MARERLVILRYNPRFLETEIPRDESGQVVLAPDFPSNEVTRTKTHSIETLYNTPDELILLPRVSNYNRTSPNLLSSNQNTFVFPPNFSSSRFIDRSLSLPRINKRLRINNHPLNSFGNGTCKYSSLINTYFRGKRHFTLFRYTSAV